MEGAPVRYPPRAGAPSTVSGAAARARGQPGGSSGARPRAPRPVAARPHGLPPPQCLREAIAEHRPLMGKLQRVSAQLVELSPEQGAPFRQRWREAEEQYGRIRERLRQAAALLEDALPRYSQVRARHQGGGRGVCPP